MSGMESVISVVKKVSPLVASALGSPIAGLALSLLGNLFGSDEKNPEEILKAINKDPDYAIKIKNMEYEHIEELSKIANDQYKTEVEDRKSAREREKNVNDKTPAILAYTLTIGVLAALFYLFMDEVPTQNKELIVSILSAMTTVWVAAMAYYHGSSVGSRNKEKIIDKTIQ